MQKMIFLFIFCLSFGAVSAQKNPDIFFTESTFDFGQIESSKSVTHDFVFFNSGSAPLLLKDVKASCGCTVPVWTRQPVMAGKNGKISVTFNPKDDAGKVFNKSIKITTNIKEGDHDKVIEIFIKGKVVAAK